MHFPIRNQFQKIALLLLPAVLFSCSGVHKVIRKGEVATDVFHVTLDADRPFGLIVLPVEIGGETYRFLFDTGAPMVISTRLNQKLGIASAGTLQVGDSQDQTNHLNTAMLDTVRIGGVNFTNIGALVADLAHAPEIKCMEIDGIIGTNLMRLAHWKLVAGKDQIEIASSAEALADTQEVFYAIPFRPNAIYKPYVEVFIDGQKIKFLIDTGSGSYISLNDKHLDEAKVLARLEGLGSTGLYGAKHSATTFAASSVQLGDFKQRGIVTFSEGDKSLVGMDFLGQFDVVFNWHTSQMLLYPREVKTPHNAIFQVLPRWQGDALIVGTYRSDNGGLPTGVNLGDTIVEVNGIDFPDAGLDGYCSYLFSDKDSLDIRFSDGRSLLLNVDSLRVD